MSREEDNSRRDAASAGFNAAGGATAVADAHKKIGVDLAEAEDREPLLDSEGITAEMSLIEKIERGPWHLMTFTRQNGVDFSGYLVFPNYKNGQMYKVPYGRPYWLPDYVKNIALESKRLETNYERASENGEPRMNATVDAIQCHPFIIERTVKGRPKEAAEAPSYK